MKIETIKDLKNFLEDLLENLNENYDDDQKVEKVSNTYFLGHPNYFLGIAGYYDGGYINLDNPVSEEEGEEW